MLLICAIETAADERIDALILDEMETAGVPGLAVAVLSVGNVVKLATYGVANIELDAPVTVDSVFELASLTKHFTAAAILLLAEEQRLALDDRLVEYVANAPPRWQDIRIEHLLSHTAGLADRFEQTVDGRPIMDHSTLDMLRSAMATPMIGVTGEQWQYSDQGYFLLGWIIEQASGRLYEEFIRERLLAPAGMDRTYVHDRHRIIPNRVAGYERYEGELRNIRRDWQFEIDAHFGIMSTIADLVRWERALYERSVLDDALLQKLWQSSWQFQRDDERSMGYGFGWFVGTIGDRTFVEHTGITGTAYFRDIDTDLAVIVLSNLGFHDVSRLGRRIAQLVDPTIQFPPSAL